MGAWNGSHGVLYEAPVVVQQVAAVPELVDEGGVVAHPGAVKALRLGREVPAGSSLAHASADLRLEQHYSGTAAQLAALCEPTGFARTRKAAKMCQVDKAPGGQDD